MRSEPILLRGPPSNGPRVEPDANPNLPAHFKSSGVVPLHSSNLDSRIFTTIEDDLNQLLDEVEPPFRYCDCQFGMIDFQDNEEEFSYSLQYVVKNSQSYLSSTDRCNVPSK